MAYDEALADRVRQALAGERGLSEKRMFGGLAMLLDGNMAVVVRGKGGLMVRVDPQWAAQRPEEPGVTETVMRGRPMRGWLTVDPSVLAGAAELRAWVSRAVTFTRGLPVK
jgi:TfoX/Sxy family transcriptional regulator of competence genes